MLKTAILNFLVGFVWMATFAILTAAQNSSNATILPAPSASPDQRILSQGKPAYQSATYGNRVAGNAVSGASDPNNPDSCSTTFYNQFYPNPVASGSYVWWYVDLGDMFAVFSVTMYNAANLPDIIFFKDLYVNVSPNNQTYGSQCGSTYGLDTTQSGVATVNCSTFIYGRMVAIYRRESWYKNMTLCKVEVFGSKLILSSRNKLSQGKPANQSSTYSVRNANLANDGIIDTTVADNCATSIAYRSYYYYYSSYYAFAWWQVDLGQFSVVESVLVYLPQNRPDSDYVTQTQALSIIVNNANNLTLGTQYSCSGFVQLMSGNIYNYTCQYSSSTATYTFGRYVMIRQNTNSNYMAVMTLCEVVVYGYTVQLAVNDTSFSFEPTIKTPDIAAAKEDYSTYKALAIAAIVIAGVTFLILVVVFAILIKLIVSGSEAFKRARVDSKPTTSNDYNGKVEETNTAFDTDPEEMYSEVSGPPVPPTKGRKKITK